MREKDSVDDGTKIAYAALYHAYAQLNRLCWQGELPHCALLMSRRLRCTLGIAYRVIPYRIKLNVPILARGDDEFILSVLAHEMTHVWQYVHGLPGGHGWDFKAEMLRIGIDEKQRRAALDSTFGYCIKQRRIFQQDAAAALRIINRSRFSAKRDFEFFMQYHNQLFQ